MGGIPDFDAIGEKPKKKAKGSRKKAASKSKQLYTRINPDDLDEKVRVDRDDPRYDEWLTPTQARREGKSEKSSDEKDEPSSTWREVGKSIGKEVKKELGKGTRKQRARIKRNVTKKVTDSVKNIDGAKVTGALSFAARFSMLAAAAGLGWVIGSKLNDRMIKDRIELKIKREEAQRGKPYTDEQMKARIAQLAEKAQEEITVEKSERLAKSRF